MTELMNRATSHVPMTEAAIINYLDRHLITCRITQIEDAKLRKAKLW